MRIAQRVQRIEPFHVMEVAKAAGEMARQIPPGAPPMLFLNIGEPDFTAPPLVVQAAEQALRDGRTQYLPALGLPALRERLSDWYGQRFGVTVPARRIVITAGASAALQLACLALIEAGDEVLMPDPCYPCNRQFVNAAEGRAVLLPCDASQRYQLDAAQVREHWGAQTRGVLLASPSNPTGTSIATTEMAGIHDWVSRQGGVTLVDEIYLGLSFDAAWGQTALALDEQIISVNSFSKYFNMTGWRLGWLVVPEALVAVIERLAQNLFICASAVAQHAALACFEPASLSVYEQRREQFRSRRDFFVPALKDAGLSVPVMPDGAFYAWADCSALCQRLGLPGSWELAFDLMRRVGVAATPGRDFGSHGTEQHIRFSTASSMEHLVDAARRLRTLWEDA
ncbi:MAG: pyridoxal phosphate-dependent aminotransferase [Alphaproteobacteria bacterium]|nr:pyridoxal phosphate-dependent aminotransferase [Alphaproteobacteria bacterium]